jgi:hypothetical protein
MLLSSSLTCHPPIACIILSSQAAVFPFFFWFVSHPLSFFYYLYIVFQPRHATVDRGSIIAVPIDGLYNFVFGPSALGIFRRIRRIVCTHHFPTVIQLMLDPPFDRHNVRNVGHMCQT